MKRRQRRQMARHTSAPAPARMPNRKRMMMRKRHLLLLPHLQHSRLHLGMGWGHRALCQLSPRPSPRSSKRQTTKHRRSPVQQQSGGTPDVVVRVSKAAERSHAHQQAGIGSASAVRERKARRKQQQQHKQAGSTGTAAEPEPAAVQTSRKRRREAPAAAPAGKQHKKRQLVVQEHQQPADTPPPQDSEQEQMQQQQQQEQEHHQEQEQLSQQPHTQQPEQLDQLDPLLREQLQLLADVCQQQQQQQGSADSAQCHQQQHTSWLVGKLQRFRAQLERQQQPLTQAEWGRVTQVAAAVAADLDATDRPSLLTQLGYVAEVAQAVPRHCVGELAFCTECRQDLEGALLVYFLVKDDGAAEHKLCRSCFLAAVWEWQEQLNQQAKAELEHAVCCCNLLEGDCTCPRYDFTTVIDMTRLNNQQRRQLGAWMAAASAQQGSSRSPAGRGHTPGSSSSSSSSGDEGSSGADDDSGGSDDRPRQPFVLPSPRHARLLVGRPLLEGGGAWPVEYCSLQGGLTALRGLTEVVRALPDFQVPPYSHLAQDRPCIVEEPMVLTKRGTATLIVDGVRGLLGLMQPGQLAEALKATPRLSADRMAEDMLIAIGLLPKRKQGRQARAAAAAAAAGGGGGNGGSGSSGAQQQQQQQLQAQVSEGLYFNFNPIDQHPHGQNNSLAAPSVAAADAAVNHHLHDLADSVRPTAYQAESWQVVRRHIKRLDAVADECRQQQSQADRGSGARALLGGRRAAYKFLSAALKARFNEATGEVAAHDLLTQVLLLLGGEGTGTRGHLDPAAAVTYAIGLVPPGQKQKQWDLATPLATWLFISPEVFADTALLLRLLWVLQHLKHQRAAADAAKQLAAMQGKGGRPMAARRAAQQAVVADAEAFAERWQQQKQQWEQRQQQGSCEDSDDRPPLSAEEQEWLTSLLLYNRLDPGEMAAVQAELGGQYAVVLVQRAGEGVSVPVGWMHWVHNSRPCIKCAWEVVRPQALAGCVLMHRRLRCRAHGLANDYLGLAPSAVKELLAWRQFL